MRQRSEQRLVEQLVTQPSDEALDEGVLQRFARCDVMPLDPALLRPAQHCHAGELGAVIGNAHGRTAAHGNEEIELTHDAQACSDVSAISARHSKRRPSDNASEAKSRLQRWLGPCGMVIGALLPTARSIFWASRKG